MPRSSRTARRCRQRGAHASRSATDSATDRPRTPRPTRTSGSASAMVSHVTLAASARPPACDRTGMPPRRAPRGRASSGRPVNAGSTHSTHTTRGAASSGRRPPVRSASLRRPRFALGDDAHRVREAARAAARGRARRRARLCRSRGAKSTSSTAGPASARRARSTSESGGAQTPQTVCVTTRSGWRRRSASRSSANGLRPSCTVRRTASSISSAVVPSSTAGRVTTVELATSGASHRCVRPTTRSAAPKAASQSLAPGSRLTTRTLDPRRDHSSMSRCGIPNISDRLFLVRCRR